MKKLFLTIIVIVLAIISLPAQKVKDALYLKNGSIIYGKLTEISGGQYTLITSDGSRLIYNASEVDKFVKEAQKFDGRKESGYGFSLEAGLLTGAQNTDYSAPFSFNFKGSLITSQLTSISLGSGVEFMGTPFTPLFFEYKHLLKETRVSPFLFGRIGALVHLGGDAADDSYYNQYDKRDYSGGFTCTFGTGITWAKDGYEPYLSFAYRYAKTSYKQYNYNNQDARYESLYNRLEIKFGISF